MTDLPLLASWWRHQTETFSASLALCAGPSVNSPHKGQWHRALMFSLICVWTNGWANHRDAGDLRRHRVHYDVNLMFLLLSAPPFVKIHIMLIITCLIYLLNFCFPLLWFIWYDIIIWFLKLSKNFRIIFLEINANTTPVLYCNYTMRANT